WLTRNHFVENAAQRIDLGPCVILSPGCFVGAHVRRCSDEAILRRILFDQFIADRPHAEINYVGTADGTIGSALHQYVAWLYVTVEDVSRMCVLQGGANFGHYVRAA